MIQRDFYTTHWIITLAVGAVCLWISLSLILRMWLVHRSVSTFKKLLWSMMLLLPLFGWLAYGGWFQIPSRHDMPARQTDGLGGAF